MKVSTKNSSKMTTVGQDYKTFMKQELRVQLTANLNKSLTGFKGITEVAYVEEHFEFF